MAPPAPAHLPALRQELKLHAGPMDATGAPSWVLHDPVNHRFFEIGWPAFEILSRWSMRDPAAIAASIRAATTLSLDEEDVLGVLRFLEHNFLLDQYGPEHTARLQQVASGSRMGKLRWLLRHYLFFRVPLIRPAPVLRVLAPWVRWCFQPAFWLALAAAAVLALLGLSFQWDAFAGTFVRYAGWGAVLGIGACLGLAKIAHEFGHALAAQRHGCRVPQMGVAFMVMVPVLYTDTTEAWKLPSRRARMQIAAAGMATELMLAVLATWLWLWLPDGPLRAGAFMLATTTWVLTLAINLSPFMRFDGYYLLSDALGIANLHERAFALGRWKLRQVLLGWDAPMPEDLGPRRTGFLIAFAYATWLYRLALFLGIALLVYHVFFKALGLSLLAVELGWFVAWPVCRELGVWWSERARVRWTRSSVATAAGAGMLLLALAVPWPTGVRAPAVLGADTAQWVYAPAAGQVRTMAVRHGQDVVEGELVLALSVPGLRYEQAGVRAREQALRWQLEQQTLSAELMARGPALREQWAAAQAELAGLQELQAQLAVKAGFAATVRQIAPGLQPGVWVQRGEPLLQLVGKGAPKVDAYVPADEVPRIEVGDRARFVPDDPGAPVVDCRVSFVDKVALSQLDHAFLGSPNGGEVPASTDGRGQTVPLHAMFRIRLDLCDAGSGARQELAGVAIIGATGRSLLDRWWRLGVGLWHREAGL